MKHKSIPSHNTANIFEPPGFGSHPAKPKEWLQNLMDSRSVRKGRKQIAPVATTPFIQTQRGETARCRLDFFRVPRHERGIF